MSTLAELKMAAPMEVRQVLETIDCTLLVRQITVIIFQIVIQAPKLVQILIRLYSFEKVRGPLDLTFGAP